MQLIKAGQLSGIRWCTNLGGRKSRRVATCVSRKHNARALGWKKQLSFPRVVVHGEVSCG